MFIVRFILTLSLALGALAGLLMPRTEELVERQPNKSSRDIVTWDEHSLFIRGERIMIYAGEFHPFRLPSPGLWLDVFQKIKAMGFSAVSFYVDWGLVEGNPGHVNMGGPFSLQDFFAAASETGIYLLARPGPYINAETASGGFPGWVDRIRGVLRSHAPDYLSATQNYVAAVGKTVAEAQITNGGPVIAVQPENEYSNFPGVINFPDEAAKEYMAFVEQQYRDAGIDVPLFVNDNLILGSFAPGTGHGEVDIYGIDAYPLRYDCGHPYTWPTSRFPMNWQLLHQQQSPTTPFMVAEFQGGAGDGWGGVGEDMCAILVNDQAVKVLFKNNYSFGVKLFNVYMIYGGTNWGNLGYQGGYTSYDYGAAITEDRHVWREKYAEMKLQANFLKASPAYLTATPGNQTNGTLASTSDIGYTILSDVNSSTKFYVVRHADFTSEENTTYSFTVSTTTGDKTLPQLEGQMSLIGRDSKIFVTDYDVGGVNLIYSTADIYTWARDSGSKRVLLLYGQIGETHEAALPSSLPDFTVQGHSNVYINRSDSAYIIQWEVVSKRQVVVFGEELEVHLLWRNDAFHYWVVELPAPSPVGNFTSSSKSNVIVKAGYLIRSASLSSGALSLVGDVNATTDLELISAPQEVSSIIFNGRTLNSSKSKEGRLIATVEFTSPEIDLPSFVDADWKHIDSLPEIKPSYDDSLWTSCTKTNTTNPRNLTTPTSLYASDYGFHSGSLIYRGRFVASGSESALFLNATGGSGFGHSVWINDRFLGSWTGANANSTYAQTFNLPQALTAGQQYNLTVLIDHTGQDEEAPGTDAVKFPRGILDYTLSSHQATDVLWKVTGNFGGEQYYDQARGPRNEGALFAERQGYHLPEPPTAGWESRNPMSEGVPSAGVSFFTTTFTLSVLDGYDVPMSFVFNKGSYNMTARGGSSITNYRVQLFVNGYQFGKYVNNLGPQTTFPIPEGVLNHNGINTVAMTLWSQDSTGAKLNAFELVPQMPTLSGYSKPGLVSMPAYSPRQKAF